MRAPSADQSLCGPIAEAAQRFGIPAAWIRAIMRVESRGDRRAVSPKGAMGLMQLMPDTWAALARSLRPRARSRSIRTTTSWRARPSCARCTTATDRRASSRRTMRVPAATKIIATGIVRCRRKPSLMLRRLSLLSRAATIDGPVLVAASDPSSWTQAPLFIARSASAEPADRASPRSPSSWRSWRHRGARRVGHRAAIRWAVRRTFPRQDGSHDRAVSPDRSCR